MNNMRGFANAIRGTMDVGTAAIYIVGFAYGIAMTTYLFMTQTYSMIGTIILYFVFVGIAYVNERDNVNMKAKLLFYDDLADQTDAFMKRMMGVTDETKQNLN